MSKKKKEPKAPVVSEDKIMKDREERMTNFLGELRKVCDLHGMDVSAVLAVNENGIVPQLKISERMYAETKQPEPNHNR